MRILGLSDEILTALEEGKISEGHTRPLLMLLDKPEEQIVLFKEIIAKKLTVREAESLSRRVATEKIRNKGKYLDPAIIEMEKTFTETLGTRVRIEKLKEGGTLTIDFFNQDDLRALLEKIKHEGIAGANKTPIATNEASNTDTSGAIDSMDDRAPIDVEKEDNTELYSLKNFSV